MTLSCRDLLYIPSSILANTLSYTLALTAPTTRNHAMHLILTIWTIPTLILCLDMGAGCFDCRGSGVHKSHLAFDRGGRITTLAIHDSLGFTRWLWWFNSTRFIFSGCSKETQFRIPNSLRFFKSYGKLEPTQLNSIHSLASMQNAANTPFCTFGSTPPHLNLAHQLQNIFHCLAFTIGKTISIDFYNKLTAIQA